MHVVQLPKLPRSDVNFVLRLVYNNPRQTAVFVCGVGG